MGLVMVISFAGFSFSVLAPVFAREVFHGDARTLGYLMGASGFGSLLAALYLGTRQSIRGLGHVIVGGGILLGLGLIGFSQTKTLVLAMVCLVSVGLGGVLMMASSNTVVQTLVDNDKRGRVMSFFTLAFVGTIPIGNLAMGSLGKWIGVRHAMLIGGGTCLLTAGAFYLLLPGIRTAAAPAMRVAEGVGE
jgi:MFS family permease